MQYFGNPWWGVAYVPHMTSCLGDPMACGNWLNTDMVDRHCSIMFNAHSAISTPAFMCHALTLQHTSRPLCENRVLDLLIIGYWSQCILGFVQRMMTSSNGNIFRVTGHMRGEFPGPRWIPHTKASERSFDVYFDLRPNKRLSKHLWGWWFETQSRPLWRHRNGNCCFHHTNPWISKGEGGVFVTPLPFDPR